MNENYKQKEFLTFDKHINTHTHNAAKNFPINYFKTLGINGRKTTINQINILLMHLTQFFFQT